MAIQTISGTTRYQVNPDNDREVQVQYRYRGRWQRYGDLCDTPKEARELVLKLAKGEQQEG